MGGACSIGGVSKVKGAGLSQPPKWMNEWVTSAGMKALMNE